MRRVLLGLLICSLGYPIVMLFSGSEFALGAALWVGMFTVGATLLVGVPLLTWFFRRHWLKWWHFSIGGAACGAVVVFPFALADWSPFGAIAAAFILIGALHGLAFWLIAVFRNARLRLDGPLYGRPVIQEKSNISL